MKRDLFGAEIFIAEFAERERKVAEDPDCAPIVRNRAREDADSFYLGSAALQFIGRHGNLKTAFMQFMEAKDAKR